MHLAVPVSGGDEIHDDDLRIIRGARGAADPTLREDRFKQLSVGSERFPLRTCDRCYIGLCGGARGRS